MKRESRPEVGLSLGLGLIDFPRSPFSTANGLNAHGDVVGFFGPALPQWEGTQQSYLLLGNTFQEIKYPGALYTGVLGINDSRAIVGWYDAGEGIYHAYLHQGGNYTNIDDPAFQNSIAGNINNDGIVIGETFDNTGNIHGFVLQGGTYTTFDPPNSIYTEPLGINSSGVIVGNFEDNNLITHGFVFRKGRYTIVDYPGASNTDLTSINDKGQMIGGFGDDVIVGGEDWPTPNAFLLDKGVFTPLNLPVGDVQVTWTYTMKGEYFVGLYVDGLGNIYGYQAQINGAKSQYRKSSR
jgi:probable HAF family extracellular repeat protein